MSIITASQKRLSELTDPGEPTSPFYNTFPIVTLAHFSNEDAKDFVTLHRPGVPPFTPEERRAILDFAKGYPLAFQVACFHVLTSEENGVSLMAAVRRAEDDMRGHLPTGW